MKKIHIDGCILHRLLYFLKCGVQTKHLNTEQCSREETMQLFVDWDILQILISWPCLFAQHCWRIRIKMDRWKSKIQLPDNF